MRELIAEEINRIVQDDEKNRFPKSNLPYFDPPLIGFAKATDRLFTEYKTIIGAFHLTPQEFITQTLGSDAWKASTVISWVLPIASHTRIANRQSTVYASKEWAQTRTFGEEFNTLVKKKVVEFLSAQGYHAVAPTLLATWQRFSDTPVGLASNWSERHAAYVAGLGTFSLNDALITPKGIAHRLGSIITDLEIAPSARPYPDYRSNCLYFREGSCGQCIDRCPVNAISSAGHDKKNVMSISASRHLK